MCVLEVRSKGTRKGARCHSSQRPPDAILSRLLGAPLGLARRQNTELSIRKKTVESTYKYRGDLAETTLPEMLCTIDHFQVPGVVEARLGEVVKRVYIRAGYVIHASSNDLRDSLGAHLLRKHTVRRDRVEELVKARSHSNKRMGVMLLERGILSPAQVLRAIREQIEAVIWSLFYWDEGEVTFSLGELDAEDMVQIQLPIRQVIVEGIRRAPDAKAVLARLGGKETILEPCFETEDLIETGLDVGDSQVLQTVDGKKTLFELCSQGPKPAGEIAKLLYAFQVLHLIGRPGETAKKPLARSGPLKIKLGSTTSKK